MRIHHLWFAGDDGHRHIENENHSLCGTQKSTTLTVTNAYVLSLRPCTKCVKVDRAQSSMKE